MKKKIVLLIAICMIATFSGCTTKDEDKNISTSEKVESLVSGESSIDEESNTTSEENSSESSDFTDVCQKFYSDVVLGNISASSPQESLGNLDVSKLPAESASAKERLEIANLLTVQDVIDYEKLDISKEELSHYVFIDNGTIMNIEDYYNAELYDIYTLSDYLKLDTTLGEMFDKNIDNRIDRMDYKAAELDSGCKTFYSGMVSGFINTSSTAESLGNLDISKLPTESAKVSERLEIANLLTVQDAIDYSKLDITEEDISNFGFTSDGTIVNANNLAYECETLRLYTTLGELYKETEKE